MSYLPADLWVPEPTIDDHGFWEGAKQQELRFQRCSECGRFRHHPTPGCARCGSLKSEWVKAKDEAELFSFTIVHYAADDRVKPNVPYNVAVVRFPSYDDVRLISNIVGTPNEELKIGMKLRLVWEETAGEYPVPRFEVVR